MSKFEAIGQPCFNVSHYETLRISLKYPNRTEIIFHSSDIISAKNVIDAPHHLKINYYVNFLGRLGSNGFQLI